MTSIGAVYNGGMIALSWFRNARVLLLLLLLLLCAACVPTSPPAPAQSALDAAAMQTSVASSNVALSNVALSNVASSNDAARPAGEARIYATQVTLLAYPIEAYQSASFDPVYRWPFLRFDRERFRAEAPPAEFRTYEMLVLENEYLQVSILPELGGRIWQILHKPTGDTMFYQNSVVKPSPWGPAPQLGWLALGGLEWALPVNEHGYDWGTAWRVTTFEGRGPYGDNQVADGSVGVRIATPDDGRLLAAEIVVTLYPGRADLSIAPTIRNVADRALDFHFLQTAMHAPGPENSVSSELRFVSPSPLMSIHSTGDLMLPGAGQRVTWPRYFGRDLSRLGNWDRYVGLFEYPRARGPFVGVYDPVADAGAVRVYPAEIAQGSKLFGLGWRNRIGSEDFTDDGSTYVELHGGLSPTFDEPYTLAGGASVQWEERWYPLHGIGNFVAANEHVALNMTRVAAGLRVALYPPAALVGTLAALTLDDSGREQVAAEFPLDLAPAEPFLRELDSIAPDAAVVIRVLDSRGDLLLEYASGQ